MIGVPMMQESSRVGDKVRPPKGIREECAIQRAYGGIWLINTRKPKR
jgi:hypothetical protein